MQEDDRQRLQEDGHVKEWQDRARVISDMKKEAGVPASPNQSPGTNDTEEDVEEKSENIRPRKSDGPY